MNRIKQLLIISFMAFFSSCSAESPAPKVIALHFQETSSNEIPDIWFDFKTEEDGTCTLVNGTGRFPNEALRAKVPAEVADSLTKIVKEEKMRKYDEHYRLPFLVLDGWQWSLHIRFEDSPSVSSSGHMERPSGDGLKRLEEYFNEVWKQVDESNADKVNIYD